MGVNSGKGAGKFIDTCLTPPQHLTVRGSVIFHFFFFKLKLEVYDNDKQT